MRADVAAGFSLGEIAAPELCRCVHAGAGLRLCVQAGPGQCRPLGRQTPAPWPRCSSSPTSRWRRCAPALKKVWPVNYNCPGQLVCAGEKSQIEAFCQKVEEAGGRAKMLAVSGGFHSPFMESASQALAQELAGMELAPSKVPVYANYTARPYDIAAKELLVNQVKNPVRWQETVGAPGPAGRGHLHRVRPGQDAVRAHPQDGKGRHGAERTGRRDLRAAVEAVKARG